MPMVSTKPYVPDTQCLVTRHYKGNCYIHSKFVRGTEVIEWTDDQHKNHAATSWRAAQLAITKYLKGKS